MEQKKIKQQPLNDDSKYILVFAIAAILCVTIFWKYNHDMEYLKKDYISSQNSQSKEIIKDIEQYFALLKQGLQTIARLPDIKNIINTEGKLDENARVSTQEIYNTLIQNLNLSEIYITTMDFQPGKINPKTKSNHKPLLSFESEIDFPHDESNEIEEYKLIRKHLDWAEQDVGVHKDMLNHPSPFISGPEVLTCDARVITGMKKNAVQNKGIIYSTPFHMPNGKLSGVVSGVILTDVIRKLLPNNNIHIVNKKYKLVIGMDNGGNDAFNKALLTQSGPDNSLIYSEMININMPDNDSGWSLRTSYPDNYFWDRRDVVSEKLFLMFALSFVIVFLFLSVMYIRGQTKIRQAEDNYKLELEETVENRTNELTSEITSHHKTIIKLNEANEKLKILLGDSETKLGETEDILSQKESHLKAIFDTVIDAIITINKHGIVKVCNPAIEEITGYKPEEIIGNNIKMIMPEAEASMHDSYLKKYDKTGRGYIVGIGREVRAQHKSGRIVPIHLAITPLKLDDVTYYVGVIRDVTEQRDMIEAVESARDSALESLRVKSDFLSNMSHELRTPMNGILGFIQLLEDTHLDEEQLAYMDTISDSANGLMEIINDALDFTRMGSGKLRIENIDFNLRMTMDSVVDFFKNTAATKGIRLQAQLSSKIPLQLMGPPGRLRQIMVNLVNNAMKYTEEGDINIRVGVLEEHKSDALLIVEVEDTGIGIDKSSQKNIFDAFRQVDSSITRLHGGLGLGLAITKSLVEMIGGEMGVNSVEGEGSTFWFTMQLSKTEIPDIDLENISLLKDKRILILDDDHDAAEALQSKLTACHAQSETIYSSLDAIQCLRDKTSQGEPADMMIIDIKKGLVDWQEIINVINKDNTIASPRKVVLTSSGQRGFGDAAKSLGVMAYLTKPIEDADLLSALNTVMSKEVDDTESIITRYTISEMHNMKLPSRILIVDDNLENQRNITHLLSTVNMRSDVAESMQDALDSLNHIEYGFILFNPESEYICLNEFVKCVRLHDEMHHIYHPMIAIITQDNQELRNRCEQAGVNDIISSPDKIKAIIQNWVKKAS